MSRNRPCARAPMLLASTGLTGSPAAGNYPTAPTSRNGRYTRTRCVLHADSVLRANIRIQGQESAQRQTQTVFEISTASLRRHTQ